MRAFETLNYDESGTVATVTLTQPRIDMQSLRGHPVAEFRLWQHEGGGERRSSDDQHGQQPVQRPRRRCGSGGNEGTQGHGNPVGRQGQTRGRPPG